MSVFDNFSASVSILLIIYSLLLYFFPPNFRNYWWGVNSRLMSKKEIIWAAGQRFFAYASFGIGLFFFIIGMLKVVDEKHYVSMMLYLVLLWKFSKYVVNEILKRKYLSYK